MTALLLAALLAAPVAAGDLSFQPPPGFAPAPELPLDRTAALAPVVGEGEPDRRLVAFLRTPEAAPATLSISTVDAPLELSASAQPALSAAIVAHFQHQLDLTLAVDRATVLDGPAPHLELWGHVAAEGGTRTVAVALYPGETRYAVAVASLPAARAEALRPAIEAALASVQLHTETTDLGWRIARIAVWGLAGLAFIAVRLLRRRRLNNAEAMSRTM